MTNRFAMPNTATINPADRAESPIYLHNTINARLTGLQR